MTFFPATNRQISTLHEYAKSSSISSIRKLSVKYVVGCLEFERSLYFLFECSVLLVKMDFSNNNFPFLKKKSRPFLLLDSGVCTFTAFVPKIHTIVHTNSECAICCNEPKKKMRRKNSMFFMHFFNNTFTTCFSCFPSLFISFYFSSTTPIVCFRFMCLWNDC